MSEKERKEKTAKSLRDVENNNNNNKNNEDDEDEEDASMKNITLNDLTKLGLDSESEAAKKFGCGTTRFKTMCVWCDVLIHFFCLLISLRRESIKGFWLRLTLHLSLSLFIKQKQMSKIRNHSMAAPEATLSPRDV